MLTHSQCEKARQATATHDPDKEIMEQFDALTDDKKEKVAKEMAVIIEKDESNFGTALYNISAKHFMTYPVIFCVFKEWQQRNK